MEKILFLNVKKKHQIMYFVQLNNLKDQSTGRASSWTAKNGILLLFCHFDHLCDKNIKEGKISTERRRLSFFVKTAFILLIYFFLGTI